MKIAMLIEKVSVHCTILFLILSNNAQNYFPVGAHSYFPVNTPVHNTFSNAPGRP